MSGRVEGAEDREAIERIGRLVRLWDEAIRIPGLGWRVGLDPLVGLVPGAGDLVGFLVSLWPIAVAIRLGVGRALVGRMLLNVVLDAGLGAVPIAGDLFDVVWRANRKNLDLLRAWAASPERVQRSSRALLAGVVIGGAALAAGAIWVAVELIKVVLRALT